MNLPLYIARRLSLRPDERRTLSPGIVIATIGIALSLMVMIFSISIVTGFKNEISRKVAGFDSQISITPSVDGSVLDVAALGSLLDSILPAGAHWTPVVRRPAVLKTDADFTGVVVKSLPEGNTRDFIAEHVVEGTLPPPDTTGAIAISATTAARLGLNVGDRAFVYFVNSGIKTRRATIAAIFDTHFGDYDRRMVYAPAPMMQSVGRLGRHEADVIEINGLNDADLERLTVTILSAAMQQAVIHDTEPVAVENIHQTGAIYLNWLNLLDTNVVVILVLMAIVAAFTLVSSTFIIILERVYTIGVLKTLGMTDTTIRLIFIFMAMKLVAIGLLVGNALALGLLAAQKTYHIIPLDAEAYFLDTVPVEIGWGWIVVLNLAAAAIAVAVLLIPTMAVCRMSPARSLNYE